MVKTSSLAESLMKRLSRDRSYKTFSSTFTIWGQKGYLKVMELNLLKIGAAESSKILSIAKILRETNALAYLSRPGASVIKLFTAVV